MPGILGAEERYLALIAKSVKASCPSERAKAFSEAGLLRHTMMQRPLGALIGERLETSGDSLRRMILAEKREGV